MSLKSVSTYIFKVGVSRGKLSGFSCTVIGCHMVSMGMGHVNHPY